MMYESVVTIDSTAVSGVRFTVAKMSYGRRVELMRQIREIARRKEFLEASEQPGDRMDAALLEADINRLYLTWGLRKVSGLLLDGMEATPELLAEIGPEELFQEALAAVRRESGLLASERKN